MNSSNTFLIIKFSEIIWLGDGGDRGLSSSCIFSLLIGAHTSQDLVNSLGNSKPHYIIYHLDPPERKKATQLAMPKANLKNKPNKYLHKINASYHFQN